MKTVTCFAPASVANVGPFYDVMGYCLNNLGDFVEASETTEHEYYRLKAVKGPYAQHLGSVSLDSNVVQFVAQQIWEDREEKEKGRGIDLVLHKYMPVGTGLGSSGASAVAAAKAILCLLEKEHTTDRQTILDYLVAGEKRTAAQPYPDNVAPSYYGGFNIISRRALQRIDVKDFYTLIILQSSLETKEQRKLIDRHFSEFLSSDISGEEKANYVLTLSRFQAREASTLVNALRDGDLALAGRVISQLPDIDPDSIPRIYPEFDGEILDTSEFDREGISFDPGNFVEFVRAGTIPNYRKIKAALLEAGALGVGISGSGPAIFAIASDENSARNLKDRTLQLLNRDNIGAVKWLISNVNNAGASVLDCSIDEYIRRLSRSHNFWEA
jgi:homoserine kinase